MAAKPKPQISDCRVCGTPFKGVAVGQKAPAHTGPSGARCPGSGQGTYFHTD